MRSTRFQISHRTDRSKVTLSLSGELDLSTIVQVTECVQEQIDGGGHDVTLDLRELSFMDSTGLRLLIELHDRSGQEGWNLRLLAPRHEAAALVLRVTGADEALPFEDVLEP